MLKFRSILIFLILMIVAVSPVSAENETAKNTYNSDINNIKFINPKDYCQNEKGEWTPYTSDTGSFKNVTMSNGYNAYSIQNSGYIETEDLKTHPSFWNDTFFIVDANDSQSVVGHWYYTNGEPIGEYLRILFYTHYDDLLHINKNSPKIPSSIFVQSFVWDFYENGSNADKPFYEYNKEAVNRYNSGFRVNNSGNVQWLKETVYGIFDFLAFKNLNRTHKDLWGVKVQLFNIIIDNSTGNSTVNETDFISNNATDSNATSTDGDKKADGKIKYIKDSYMKFDGKNPIEKLDYKTGKPVDVLIILICLAILAVLIYSAEKQKK